ncbi:MAG: LemA family protein, partial [Ilumatobacteraceae bacterium]
MVVPYLIALVCAFGVVMVVRKRWRYTDTPTSAAGHVFPGLTEVQGVVEAIGRPFAAATDGAPCVWWSYTAERKHTSSKTESTWVVEERGVTAAPFRVRDASGAVTVVIGDQDAVVGAQNVDVAQLSLAHLRPFARVMSATYEPGPVRTALGSVLGGVLGGSDLTEPIAELGGSWRAKEERLQVGDRVFLTAHARLTPTGDAVELASTDAAGKHRTFELSVGDEKTARGRFAPWFTIILAAVVGLTMSVFGGRESAGPNGVWLVPAVLVGAMGVLWMIGQWNRVRRARERCHFAWSLIDVACEQRSQTIPQLQAVVGAALAHEQSLLSAVAAARQVGRAPSAGGAG